MALIKGKGIHTTGATFAQEGSDVFARLTRDGALFTSDWFLAQALAGNVFALNSGKLTTPDTFNATVADGEPDLLINVPTGRTVIPVYISVGFEDTGTALAVDTFAVISDQYDNAVTATAETSNIKNMRTDEPKKSLCSAYSVVTGGGATLETGNYIEFWRPYAGLQEDAYNSSTTWKNPFVGGAYWSIKNTVVPPIVKGQGALAVFAGAQAGTGFITVIWVELPSTSLV